MYIVIPVHLIEPLPQTPNLTLNIIVLCCHFLLNGFLFVLRATLGLGDDAAGWRPLEVALKTVQDFVYELYVVVEVCEVLGDLEVGVLVQEGV
jgi:hypothetical protein